MTENHDLINKSRIGGKRFGNVGLEAAKDIGQETVRYVSNIYKYYVAYELILEQSEQRE